MLIKEVLTWLEEPAERPQSTVDGLKSGEESAGVTGIATAFMATYSVISQAASLGVNLLITHEGVFYSHEDRKRSELTDPVMAEKQRLIEQTGIAIYRCHDHVHRYRPDGITAGLIRELGWDNYIVEQQPAAAIAEIPPASLKEVAEHAKRALGIAHVRAVGELSLPCKRVGLLVGYRGGGALSIPLFEREQLDLIIAGEGPEWETPEYVRDACSQGRQKGLLLLGHAQSEEPGMRRLAERLKERFADVPVHFIPGSHDFRWI